MRDILADLDHGFETKRGDPMTAAQTSMRPKLPKRFYTDVTVEEGENGFAILLDGSTIRTPGKIAIAVATRTAAQLVADEFGAQKDVLDPATMPMFRLANTAIDGVARDPQAVVEDIIRFSGTDLLCYRASEPQELVELQRRHWDGPLDWIEQRAGARFNLAEGVMHVTQPRETIAAFGNLLRPVSDPVMLAALHSMTTLLGSAILALAVFEGHLSHAEAWNAAHVDEDWQISQWGSDEEAEANRIRRWVEMDAAARMIDALRG